MRTQNLVHTTSPVHRGIPHTLPRPKSLYLCRILDELADAHTAAAYLVALERRLRLGEQRAA